MFKTSTKAIAKPISPILDKLQLERDKNLAKNNRRVENYHHKKNKYIEKCVRKILKTFVNDYKRGEHTCRYVRTWFKSEMLAHSSNIVDSLRKKGLEVSLERGTDYLAFKCSIQRFTEWGRDVGAEVLENL